MLADAFCEIWEIPIWDLHLVLHALVAKLGKDTRQQQVARRLFWEAICRRHVIHSAINEEWYVFRYPNFREKTLQIDYLRFIGAGVI